MYNPCSNTRRLRQRPGPHCPRCFTRIITPNAVQSTDVAKRAVQFQMKECELPQILSYKITPSEMISATLLFQFSTVDARYQRATNRDNAHQRHTRSIKSSSCAESSLFSSPICLCTQIATHARRTPAVVVASSPPSKLELAAHQRFSSTCLPDRRPSNAFEVCCSWLPWPNDHHRAVGARIRLVPQARLFTPWFQPPRPPHSPLRLSSLHWLSRLRPRAL